MSFVLTTFPSSNKNLGGRGRLKTSKTGTWRSVLLGKFIPFLSELEFLEAPKTPGSVKLPAEANGGWHSETSSCVFKWKKKDMCLGHICDFFLIFLSSDSLIIHVFLGIFVLATGVVRFLFMYHLETPSRRSSIWNFQGHVHPGCHSPPGWPYIFSRESLMGDNPINTPE